MGREPSPRPAIRSIGVAARKKAAKPGCSTSARYAVREIAASSVIVEVPPAAAPATSRSCSGVEASSAAAVTCSRWRWAIVRSAKCAATTSPCSVNLSRPSTDPGAWARIARLAGPPPRPMAPPRPWNSVSVMPCRRAVATSASCARYSSQFAARNPLSFDESE